jgi:hypothetical protein
VTKTQLIELADARTERRGKTLNLKLEYLNALQEFCLESRFYWRRKTLTFNTQAGISTYDLSSSITVTTNLGVSAFMMRDVNGVLRAVTIDADGNLVTNPASTISTTTVGVGSGADVEELIDVNYVRTSSNICTLTKIFDREAQDEIIEDTTTGEPGSVFIEPGTSQTLRISPIPAGAYKIRAAYWAVPNMDPEDSSETIPLVPAWQHRTVAKLMERNIFGFLFGEESGKYLRADSEYQKQLQQAMGKRDGMLGKVTEWKSRDRAVRSTH